MVYPILTQSLDIYATMFPSCAEDLATSDILAAIFENISYIEQTDKDSYISL